MLPAETIHILASAGSTASLNQSFNSFGAALRTGIDPRQRVIGWDGYVPPDEVPTIVNPASGYIVSANHRVLGGDYPIAIGHDFPGGYRAWRIGEQLKPLPAYLDQGEPESFQVGCMIIMAHAGCMTYRAHRHHCSSGAPKW